MELTELEVELIVKELSLKLFNEEFDLPVKRNNRLTKSQARFCSKLYLKSCEIKPISIECSRKIYDGTYKLNTVIGILAHELCHWWLCKNEKPYGDTDMEFKKLIKKFGIPQSVKVAGHANSFYCSKCGKFIIASYSNKFSKDIYHSKCCHADLICKKEYFEDENDLDLKFNTMNLETVQELLNKKLKKAQ